MIDPGETLEMLRVVSEATIIAGLIVIVGRLLKR